MFDLTSNIRIHHDLIALGWTILHFLWQGSAIALLYLCIDRAFHAARVEFRYVISYVMFLLLAVCAATTYVCEVRTVTVLHGDALLVQQATVSVQSQVHSAANALASFNTPELPSRFSIFRISAYRVLAWLDMLWLVGVLLLIVRTIASCYQLKRLLARATGIVPDEVRVILATVEHKLGITRDVLVKMSDEVITPFAAGLIRTVVVLPVSMCSNLAPADVEVILAHELAHIKRWDYSANLLQVAIETLLFFHPAVWWMSRHVRERREMCCDQVGVQMQGATRYAEALLLLEDARMAGHLAMPLQGEGGPLRRRIEYLLLGNTSYRLPSRAQMSSIVLCAAIACLAVGARVDVAAATRHVQAIIRYAAGPQNDMGVIPVKQETKNQHGDTSSRPVVSSSLTQQARPATQTRIEDEYVRELRAAGLKIDTVADHKDVAALRSLDVTPQYVRDLSRAGMGAPRIQDLAALKTMDITPAYVSGLVQDGIAPATLRELPGIKAYQIDTDYSRGITSLGFGALNGSQLLRLRQHGATLNYASWFRSHFPNADLSDLQHAASSQLSDEDIGRATATGIPKGDLNAVLALKNHKTAEQ
jgi:beta-lactamase regulating signal transducer with metallopeptidase domain